MFLRDDDQLINQMAETALCTCSYTTSTKKSMLECPLKYHVFKYTVVGDAIIYTHELLPSSGVITVIVVLKGPRPTEVRAAMMQT